MNRSISHSPCRRDRSASLALPRSPDAAPETGIDSPVRAPRWIKQSIEHWRPLLEEGVDLGVDWTEAHDHCWRCGHSRSLQRCHIVPRMLGGTLEPGNVIPLCADCHAEAPDTDDACDMLKWLKDTCNKGVYNTYWLLRCWREAGRPEFVNQAHATKTLHAWAALLRTSMGMHATHVPTSTKTALFQRAHQRVLSLFQAAEAATGGP